MIHNEWGEKFGELDGSACNDALLDLDRSDSTDFEKLKGKTIVGVRWDDTPRDENHRLAFMCDDGSVLVMWHEQDCCESVTLEDIVGDMDDLIGSPVVQAEESSSNEVEPSDDVSCTWTFYKLATAKGYVTLRWFGASNGYYSESVYTVWIVRQAA